VRSSKGGRTYRSDYERFHTVSRIVGVLLDESRIDNVNDTIDSDRSLSDVRSEDDLSSITRGQYESNKREK